MKCHNLYPQFPLKCHLHVVRRAKTMRLRKLGEQIVIKPKFTFSKIKFECFDTAEKEQYYVLRIFFNVNTAMRLG